MEKCHTCRQHLDWRTALERRLFSTNHASVCDNAAGKVIYLRTVNTKEQRTYVNNAQTELKYVKKFFFKNVRLNGCKRLIQNVIQKYVVAFICLRPRKIENTNVTLNL